MYMYMIDFNIKDIAVSLYNFIDPERVSVFIEMVLAAAWYGLGHLSCVRV